MNTNQIHPCVHYILDGCPLDNCSRLNHLNPNAVDAMYACEVVYLLCLTYDSLHLESLRQVLW